MLKITNHVFIPISEIELSAIRAQGAGGQNVNKVSTAIHLRYNIQQSSLPEVYKTRLLQLNDYRITSEGVIIIKAQKYRSQEKNREDALERLVSIISKVTSVRTTRKKTKPSKSSIKKRLESKKIHSNLKKMRQSPE